IGHDRQRLEQVVRAVRGALPPGGLAAALAASEAATVDEAYALAERAEALDERRDPRATPAQSPFSITRGAAPALAVHVLGPLALARHGVAVVDIALPTAKARELLYFLLLTPRATKDQIGLALWPDASAAQVRNNFHVTLHHLRRALGDRKWIVFDEEGYRLERAPAPDARLDADVDDVLAAAEALLLVARRQQPLDADALESAR
ncbi:hypothetical protein PYV61_26375, partial [Roseisolibacter sp. H3M3-2]